MPNFRKFITELSRSRVGVFVRKFTRFRPPSTDLRYGECVSDLFIWRDPKVWNNFFDLNHLGSILNPKYTDGYQALLEIYSSEGRLLHTERVDLAYGKNNLLQLNDILYQIDDLGEFGTFSVFHLADLKNLVGGKKICVSERGMVSYKRISDSASIRSYVHGNVNARGYSQKNNVSRLLGIKQPISYFYRPQLSLTDCKSAELIFVNHSPVKTQVDLFCYEENCRRLLSSFPISPGGTALLSSSFDFPLDCIIEVKSNLNFLRPVIFKYYPKHFDVIHG